MSIEVPGGEIASAISREIVLSSSKGGKSMPSGSFKMGAWDDRISAAFKNMWSVTFSLFEAITPRPTPGKI